MLLFKGVNIMAFHVRFISELWSVACHVGYHSVTGCHLTQVNTFCLNPSQTRLYSIYSLRRDGRLSWTWCWLCTVYCIYVYVCWQTVI